MPPPLLKIRELEQENGRLQKENDELRRLLTDSTSHSRFSSDAILRRTSVSSYPEFRGSERDYKRRKADHPGGLYMGGGENHETSGRAPPPLTIPQPLSHHYGNIGSNSSSHGQNPPLFNLPNPGFQMPNTPSGSSATSSPPFSASVFH
ncbi:hypothetical protein CPB83DRAFT_849498 [Crepidotus variabilis]|uniref:Uncharacterized protein n=1 Tax=Crepidotus variabilis TaxID=179855 RepID=A0A9P6ELM2_9AGAR|nr:hypothetical protein CPB83DRAFT_849498 [Crepidotus variabilis]